MQPILYYSMLIFSLIWNTSTYRILAIYPVPTISHFRVTDAILLELARKGHNVTVITAFELSDRPDNFRLINAGPVDLKILGAKKQKPNKFDSFASKTFIYDHDVMWKLLYSITDATLNSSGVKEFIESDQSEFDAVICEEFFINAYYIFAHKYKAPLVLISTFGPAHYISNYMGQSLELATVPHEFMKYFGSIQLWQRVEIAIYTAWDLMTRSFYLKKHDEIAAKHFKNQPTPLPSVKDLERDASLVLINTHFSIDVVRPNLPNVVEIGGVHINKPKPLPTDLQDVLDRSDYGVIYFSLGSVLMSSELPAMKTKIFMDVFSELKETIIWKLENDTLQEKPKNVVIRKWLPQNDILAHPNVKLFITHGGLLSFQEALYYGVPIVGMPIYGDQHRNIAKAKYMGFGEHLDFNNLEKDIVQSTINNVLTNKSYTTKVKEYAQRLKDRPQNASQEAIFWIEYIIRHKGAKFLKPPSVWMPWYEYYMLDVCSILVLVVVLTVAVFYYFIKTVLRFVPNVKRKHLKSS